VIRITDEIQFDGITARVENGLLTVTLPKSEASQPRKIVVSE
jgi:HSP20 family molecular chaperone IbpA